MTFYVDDFKILNVLFLLLSGFCNNFMLASFPYQVILKNPYLIYSQKVWNLKTFSYHTCSSDVSFAFVYFSHMTLLMISTQLRRCQLLFWFHQEQRQQSRSVPVSISCYPAVHYIHCLCSIARIKAMYQSEEGIFGIWVTLKSLITRIWRLWKYFNIQSALPIYDNNWAAGIVTDHLKYWTLSIWDWLI